eukprot:5560067-Alexandrium_andersonii.AAC.1
MAAKPSYRLAARTHAAGPPPVQFRAVARVLGECGTCRDPSPGGGHRDHFHCPIGSDGNAIISGGRRARRSPCPPPGR